VVQAYRRLIHEARQYTQCVAEEAFEDDATTWQPLSTVLREGPRNGVTIAPVERMTGCWGLTIGSAGDWGFDPSGTKSIAVPEAGDHAVVREGDLFITRSNTQERVGLPFRAPQGLPESTYYSDLLVRLRPDPDEIPTWLLEVFLRSPRGRATIRAISAGTSASMKKINGRNLQRVLVPRLEDSAVARLQILVQRLDTFIERAGALEADAMRLRGSLATALLEGRT
jgi:type I restriction enzyme, S subunit